MTIARRVAAALLVAGLMAFYYAAASEHARVVNTSKARGDQSGYLWDAQQVYWNWHGRTPRVLVGERNRMPLYAAYLALFYSPDISDDDYFVIAKRWNIRLSLVLLAALAIVFFRQLPPLAAANLTAVVAFGYLHLQGRIRSVGAAVLFPVLPRIPHVLASAAGAGPPRPAAARGRRWHPRGSRAPRESRAAPVCGVVRLRLHGRVDRPCGQTRHVGPAPRYSRSARDGDRVPSRAGPVSDQQQGKVRQLLLQREYDLLRLV